MARRVRPVEMAHVRESENNSKLSAETIRRLEFDVAAALRGRDAGAHGHGAAVAGGTAGGLRGVRGISTLFHPITMTKKDPGTLRNPGQL